MRTYFHKYGADVITLPADHCTVESADFADLLGGLDAWTATANA